MSNHGGDNSARDATHLLSTKPPSRHRADKETRLENYLYDDNFVAALMDNLSVSLHTENDPGALVEPIRIDEEEGRAVVRRSLTFVFGMACHIEFPGRTYVLVRDIDHLAHFFAFPGMETVSPAEVDRLRARMLAIVEADMPIREVYLRYADAAE
ncbi:unnamed protein product [Phaeothamnion confervicola]